MKQQLTILTLLSILTTAHGATYETDLSCSGMDNQGRGSLRVDPNLNV